MKTTLHTLSALLAGLFLNVGLGRFAECFDCVSQANPEIVSMEVAGMPTYACDASIDITHTV